MVPPEVSLHHIRTELEQAKPIVDCFRLQVDTSMLSQDDLRVRVTGASRVDSETYVVEMRFDGYRMIPPFVEFVDPSTGEPGARSAYPSCFHGHPCICSRYNRKTYQGHSGLHSDWHYGDWSSEPSTESIGGMLNHIFASINGHLDDYQGHQPYKGRMT